MCWEVPLEAATCFSKMRERTGPLLRKSLIDPLAMRPQVGRKEGVCYLGEFVRTLEGKLSFQKKTASWWGMGWKCSLSCVLFGKGTVIWWNLIDLQWCVLTMCSINSLCVEHLIFTFSSSFSRKSISFWSIKFGVFSFSYGDFVFQILLLKALIFKDESRLSYSLIKMLKLLINLFSFSMHQVHEKLSPQPPLLSNWKLLKKIKSIGKNLVPIEQYFQLWQTAQRTGSCLMSSGNPVTAWWNLSALALVSLLAHWWQPPHSPLLSGLYLPQSIPAKDQASHTLEEVIKRLWSRGWSKSWT